MDIVGILIVVHESIFLSQLSCLVSFILVGVDFRLGLFESLELVSRNKSFTLDLDYLKVPFCCARFYLYGHVILDCTHKFKMKICCKKVLGASSIHGMGLDHPYVGSLKIPKSLKNIPNFRKSHPN